MQKITTKKLVFTALIAAIYTVMCLALPMLSYGAVQIRFSEALTLLPVFSPIGVWGVTLGCALSNLVGFFSGLNMGIDVVFGTLATLLAALMSRRLRHIRTFGLPVLSAIPPVLVNAVIIGAEIAYLSAQDGEAFLPAFVFSATYVGLGQLVACIGFGLPLAALLERTGIARLIFGREASEEPVAEHHQQG